MKKTKEIIIGIALLIFFFILFLGVIKHNNKSNSYAKIVINGKEILISENSQEDTFDLDTLNNEYDTILNIELNNAKIKINNQTIKKSKEISLGKINISEESKIEIEVKLSGEFNWKKYIINTLPTQFPSYEFEGEAEEDGEYYVATYALELKKDQHYIYKLDKKGNVTFYQATPKVCYNFKKNSIDGKTRYTYLQSFGEMQEGFTLSLPTKLVVLNEKYEKIDEIYYNQGQNEGIPDDEKKLDNHDYIYLSENHYILSGFEKKEVLDFPGYEGEPFGVWNCKIQEILNGKVLWEFQSVENKQIYNYCNEENMEVMKQEPHLDYMHFNSMKIDETDGNLICSFRNIDCIMKIDRTTGKIMWVLGGPGDEFGLKEEQQFSNQHSISFLSDHSILIYDNGCKNKKTRILKIKLDEKNKKIETFKQYDLDVFARLMGSIQIINEKSDTYLITYGVGEFEYAFQELKLETLEPITSFKSKGSNSLYCVNKYK